MLVFMHSCNYSALFAIIIIIIIIIMSTIDTRFMYLHILVVGASIRCCHRASFPVLEIGVFCDVLLATDYQNVG